MADVGLEVRLELLERVPVPAAKELVLQVVEVAKSVQTVDELRVQIAELNAGARATAWKLLICLPMPPYAADALYKASISRQRSCSLYLSLIHANRSRYLLRCRDWICLDYIEDGSRLLTTSWPQRHCRRRASRQGDHRRMPVLGCEVH